MGPYEILLSAVGVIGIAGGAVGYFAKARGDSIITYLTKENLALKEYNQTLEKQNVALKSANDLKDAQITDLKDQLVKEIHAIAKHLKKDSK